MIPTPFMSELSTKLKEARKISDSTALQYLQTLYKLNGSEPFKSLAWCKKYDTVQDIINTYAPSTQRTQYMVLTSTLSLVKSNSSYKSAYLYWQDKMTTSNKAKNEEPVHEKSEKQEKTWVDWEQVLGIKKDLADKVNSFISKKSISRAQFDDLFNFMLLSLYTEMPPRRNQDYFYMVVVPKWNDTMDKAYNYYDMSTNKFIFNKYKTARTYGLQTIDVPESLANCIKTYIKFHPLRKNKSFPLIVKYDGELYKTSNSITRCLNTIFGKRVGSSSLRHSYLSSKYGNITKEREEDAKEMGHSVEMANQYIKY